MLLITRRPIVIIEIGTHPIDGIDDRAMILVEVTRHVAAHQPSLAADSLQQRADYRQHSHHETIRREQGAVWTN
jgi:hypothetical protein